jgi:CRP/FNR family transcriptional regulator
LTFVARSTFLECLHRSPSLYSYLVDTLVARLRRADEEVVAASFFSLKARVARALLKFAEHLGEPTNAPDQFEIRELRQEDVAALADVARENVSRILSEWRKHKLIVPRTSTVYVILKSRLEREAAETSIGSCMEKS